MPSPSSSSSSSPSPTRAETTTTPAAEPAKPQQGPQLRPLRGPVIKVPPTSSQLNPDFTVEDSLPGKQYTNFEARKNAAKIPALVSKYGKDDGNAPHGKVWTQVSEIPDDGSVPYTTVTINPENIICFSGRNHWLSNFHRANAKIDGNDYPSVEHYYQACKLYMLAGPRFSNQIRRIPDPGTVKVTARRLLRNVVSDQQIEQWKVVEGPRLLEYGMIHKFVQNPKLRSQLMGTGDSLLVHAYDRDKVFASNMLEKEFGEWAEKRCGEILTFPEELSAETVAYFPLIGEGKNLLGLIAMRVRDQIRRYVDSLETQTQKAEKSEKSEGAEKSELEKSMDAVLAAALGAVSLSSAEMERENERKAEQEQRAAILLKKKKDNRYLE